jgi:hypothetical protein
MPAPYAHGLITVAIGMTDRIIIASDSAIGADAVGLPMDVSRAIEVERGFVVGGSGIWSTADGLIDTQRDVIAAFRHEDTAETFLQRYDRLYRHVIENFLTLRFREAPDVVLRECFSPLIPPQSLVVCQAGPHTRRVTIFEYIPTLTNDDHIVLTPLIQTQEASDEALAFAAVGAAAPFVDLLERSYIETAMRGPRGPEHAARALIDQATGRTAMAVSPAQVHTFGLRGTTPQRRAPIASRAPFPTTSTEGRSDIFPPVDTKNLAAVEQFVREKFNALYPNSRLSWLPTVFTDIGNFFAGRDPDYSAIDLRYHDLEHTLQATVCLALIIAGRQATRIAPRIDAHHFELAMIAALLHDSGYLKLRSDTRGTGAKYTFCHVLRSCSFAASYLPNIGASGADVETVMSAINCTGPMNEISRLRFRAPVDEIIGYSVATADFLGQLAATDYPDELEVLFEEFQESDDFLHVPVEERMFKSAHDLMVRTPHFWHRFVLPKLESDFQGVYRFLAKPYPDGPNAYLKAIESNITEIQRRLQTVSRAQSPFNRTSGPISSPATDTPPPLEHPPGTTIPNTGMSE